MTIRFRIVNLALAAALLFYGLSALAQDDPPGNIAEMWVFHVSNDNTQAFEEAMTAHVAMRKEAGDPYQWETWTKSTGKLSGYFVRTCCFAWEDRDAYDKWNSDNPQVFEHFQANVDPHVESYEHHFEEIDFENSHWPADMPEPKYVGVTTYKLAPGGWQATNSAKEAMSQVALNNGWANDEHQWAWMSSVNGSPTIALVIPYTDYADMATPDPTFYEFLSEQVGAEEAGAHFERFNSGIKGSYYEIYGHRPDLSTPE